MTVAARRRLTPVDPATLEPVGTVEVDAPGGDRRRSSRRRGSCSGGGRSRGTTSAGRCSSASPTSCWTRPTTSPRRSRPRRGSRCSRRIRPSSSSRSSSSAGRRRTRSESSQESACASLSLTSDTSAAGCCTSRYGAVAVIAPWNFPFGIPFTQTIAAVAAGNAVIVKPSELAPLIGRVGRARVRGSRRASRGSSASPTVTARRGEALVRARGIAKVFFTGSTGVGRNVALAARRAAVPVSLELGRQGRDARLRGCGSRSRVEGALWGSFSNCGQTCASVERIYVARDLYQPFVEELGRARRAAADRARQRLPTELGPLISEQQRDEGREARHRSCRRGSERGDGRRPSRTSVSRAGSTSRPC